MQSQQVGSSSYRSTRKRARSILTRIDAKKIKKNYHYWPHIMQWSFAFYDN